MWLVIHHWALSMSCQVQTASKISKPQSSLHCMQCVCVCSLCSCMCASVSQTTSRCPSFWHFTQTKHIKLTIRCATWEDSWALCPCFLCWVNLHPAEVEVLATAAYTSCKLQNLIKTATAVQDQEQNKGIKTTDVEMSLSFLNTSDLLFIFKLQNLNI